jgi:glucosamine-6-phosphate deaminase
MENRKVRIFISEDNEGLGKKAAEDAGRVLEEYTSKLNKKCIAVFAAAPSQDTFLKHLSKNKNIRWENIYAFHLDEYLDLPEGHPNTFKEYLRIHIFDKVDIPDRNIFYLKDAGNDGEEIIKNYTKSFREKYKEVKKEGGVYVAFIGIGVNGHIAFNEPCSNLWTEQFLIEVQIDDISAKQQYDDYKNHPNPHARYKSLDEVPRNALSMSVSGILLADKVFCMVPGGQKADAVKLALEGEISDRVPASFLRLHNDVSLYLDKKSSSKLNKKPECKI